MKPELKKQLDYIFNPRAVAVIGASASPQKLGYVCLQNLIEFGFKGRLYPVNPREDRILGLKVHPSVEAIPGEVDLAVVVIPAGQVIGAVEQCAVKGVKGVVVISGGFKEAGTEVGLELQSRLQETIAGSNTRLIGPNTVGIFNPHAHLLASFQISLKLSQPGNVAVVTQSGGMCTYIVHALTNHNVGISKAFGLGNRCNLSFDEVISYLAEDEDTRVIALYIEGLEQPRLMMQAARAVVRRKPILAYKGGRSPAVNRAALSHTGTMTGQYELYQAAFKQSGIIEVNSITDLVDTAKALDMQPPAADRRVAILSVQAGGGIVITDRCRELGLELAKFAPETHQRLRSLIALQHSVDNPIDVAWASDDYETCRQMLKATLADESVDGTIVAAVWQASNMELMRALRDTYKEYGKPVTVCLDSPLGAAVPYIAEIEADGIPTYPLPERAATGLAGLAKYGQILKELAYE